MNQLIGLFRNKSSVIGAVLGMAIWAGLAFGLESKVPSPLTGQDITRQQLILEVVGVDKSFRDRQGAINDGQNRLNRDMATAAETYEIKFNRLDKKDATGGAWLNLAAGAATTYATGGLIDPVSLLGSAFGLLGIGAAAGATVEGGKKIRRKIKTPE